MKIRIKNPIWGVPVTFLYSYNPSQFEIVGLDRYVEDNPHYGKRFTINNKETYARILIKRKMKITQTKISVKAICKNGV